MPIGYDFASKQMMDYYIQANMVRERLGALRRHLRLMVAGGSRVEAAGLGALRRKGMFGVHEHWRYIDRNRGCVAVSGSLALSAFGLLEKIHGNIDLVHFGGDLSESPCRSAVPVRVWPAEGQLVYESGGYHFQNPFQVMLMKVDMVLADPRLDKHLDDLMQAAPRIGFDIQ